MPLTVMMLELEIYPSTICLIHLLVSRNVIEFAILKKMRSCLFEVERNIGIDALFTNVEHPIVITHTGVFS